MNAIKVTNGFGHDQILNLDRISSIEIPSSKKALTIWFGKDHIQITFRSEEDRDEVFRRACEVYGVLEEQFT